MRIKTLFIPAACVLMIACGTTAEKSSTTGATPAASEPAKTAAETKVAKHPWGSFKVGSYVVTKSTTEVAGRKMTTEMKTTLTALTADKATVEMATTVMGNTTKTMADFPITAGATTATPTGTVSMPNAEVKTSEETITVAGKAVNCKVTSTTSDANGMKSESKTWMSDEVPGFVVKTVIKTTGPAKSETTSEVTDFKAS